MSPGYFGWTERDSDTDRSPAPTPKHTCIDSDSDTDMLDHAQAAGSSEVLQTQTDSYTDVGRAREENTHTHKMDDSQVLQVQADKTTDSDDAQVASEYAAQAQEPSTRNDGTETITVIGTAEEVVNRLRWRLKGKGNARWLIRIEEQPIFSHLESGDFAPLGNMRRLQSDKSTQTEDVHQEDLGRAPPCEPEGMMTGVPEWLEFEQFKANRAPARSAGPRSPSPRTLALMLEIQNEPENMAQGDNETDKYHSDMDTDYAQALAGIHTGPEYEDRSNIQTCGWCDREGHQASDCIKWDPIHFDKAVCILCNNRGHTIDECSRFDDLGVDDRAKLLVNNGAMKPGVRSVGSDWPQFCTTWYTGKGFPMSRDYIRSLEAGPNGQKLKDMWQDFDYLDRIPDIFDDKNLNTVEKIIKAKLDEEWRAPR